ncbi:MAG: phosphatase PAP2 family protein, partial [Bifidobacteriaceae bacterium]|nr:phosphatase PAP2 family protein [Bifidobacteriaceae bacterium]
MSGRNSILPAAGWALLCGLGVALVFKVAVGTHTGQAVDAVGMDAAVDWPGVVAGAAQKVLDAVSLATLAAACVVLAGIAWARRRPLVAIGAVALVAGANLTTQTLKYEVLDRVELAAGGMVNSFPSGHTTVAASVSFALILTVGARSRVVWAWVGALYTGGTGISTVVLAWHRPSDAVGGILVAGAWTGLVVLIGAVGRTVRSRRAGGRASQATSVAPGTAAAPGGAWLLGLLGVAGVLAGAASAAALAAGAAGGRWEQALGTAMTAAGIMGCALAGAAAC